MGYRYRSKAWRIHTNKARACLICTARLRDYRLGTRFWGRLWRNLEQSVGSRSGDRSNYLALFVHRFHPVRLPDQPTRRCSCRGRVSRPRFVILEMTLHTAILLTPRSTATAVCVSPFQKTLRMISRSRLGSALMKRLTMACVSDLMIRVTTDGAPSLIKLAREASSLSA